MLCNFATTQLPNGRNRHECRVCRRVVVARGERVHAKCRAAGEIEPRSEEEQSSLAAICQSCEHYLPDDDGCRKCGCGSSRREAMASKRRIGHCPLGKW